jgi:MraZ protein
MTMDTKGRVTIPSSFSQQFERWAVIARSVDHCVLLFNPDGWREEIERFKAELSQIKPAASGLNSQRALRIIFSRAQEVIIQAFGDGKRVAIPGFLRKHAGLKRKVVFAGCGKYIEIWNITNWRREKRKIREERIRSAIGLSLPALQPFSRAPRN